MQLVPAREAKHIPDCRAMCTAVKNMLCYWGMHLVQYNPLIVTGKMTARFKQRPL